MAQPIETVVKKFQQGEVEIYVGTLNTADLRDHDIFAVDARDPDGLRGRPDGYQRWRDDARCKKVAEFVRNVRLLPVNIILNLRGNGKFTPLEGNDAVGLLEIPREKEAAWVVDGQHRLGGFDHLEPELQIDVPVVIFKDLPRSLEMFHFKVINEEQKKVNLSLAVDLLGDLRGGPWQFPGWKLAAHDAVKRLNEDPDSPWYGQVNMIGARGMGRPINQVTFVNALKPLLQTAASTFQAKSVDEQATFLKDFWHAVAEAFPIPWSMPRGYLLKKTLGVHAMSRVAGRVYALCERDGDFSRASIREYVRKLESFNWDSAEGHFAGYGGMRGVEMATDALLKALPFS